MGKYIIAPISLTSGSSEGYQAQPPYEKIDKILKRQELSNCPIRACIEAIGQKLNCRSGRGSNFAKGKRYLKNICGCSTASIKTLFTVYYKLNSPYIPKASYNVLKYDVKNCAELLKTIISAIEKIYEDYDNKIKDKIFTSDSSGKLYIDKMYSIQKNGLNWLADDLENPQAQQAKDLICKINSIIDTI